MIENQSEWQQLFKLNYYKKHKLCPVCKHSGHSSTLAAYILHWDRRNNYKDLNDCVCSNCENQHTIHDRIPENENYFVPVKYEGSIMGCIEVNNEQKFIGPIIPFRGKEDVLLDILKNNVVMSSRSRGHVDENNVVTQGDIDEVIIL